MTEARDRPSRSRRLRRRLGSATDPARRRVRFLLSTWHLRRPTPSLTVPDDPALIISLTSFPERIHTVWATIATLLRQTHRPDVIVLVLAEDQFPDRRIPSRLRKIERKGVRILWTPRNLRGLTKLLPTREQFPDATIVTVDDDVLYEPDLLEHLLTAAEINPATIVGSRGWIIMFGPSGPTPYFSWMASGRADPETPTDRLFLTGIGGILYPPIPAFDARILDAEAALRTTPTADDVWFWAAGIAAGVPRHCTGGLYGQSNGLDGLSPALLDANRHRNDAQISAAIQHFGLEQWFRDQWEGEVGLPSEP